MSILRPSTIHSPHRSQAVDDRTLAERVLGLADDLETGRLSYVWADDIAAALRGLVDGAVI